MDENVLLVEVVQTSVIEVDGGDVLVVSDDDVQILSEGLQGPEGIQGPKGDPGGSEITEIAGAAIGGHRVVVLDATGRAVYASNDQLGHATRIVGITKHAAVEGAPVGLQIYGAMTEPTWSWDTSLPVFLGSDGLLTQTQPTAPLAKFSVVVGFPISATTLFIKIGIPISITQ